MSSFRVQALHVIFYPSLIGFIRHACERGLHFLDGIVDSAALGRFQRGPNRRGSSNSREISSAFERKTAKASSCFFLPLQLTAINVKLYRAALLQSLVAELGGASLRPMVSKMRDLLSRLSKRSSASMTALRLSEPHQIDFVCKKVAGGVVPTLPVILIEPANLPRRVVTMSLT